ncbi:MAG TPA: lipopolysaccharide kinase InaA family protein [Geomonas sp.]
MNRAVGLALTEARDIGDGYQQFTVAGRIVVTRPWAAQALREALAAGTLYAWAAAQPGCDVMQGRGACYGVELPSESAVVPVVVRRNRHGGLLRYLTGEQFLTPTRAPLELSNSLRLAAAGIPTPEVVAYAVYPTFGGLARCDVMTRRLPPGADLPEAWRTAHPGARDAMLAGIAALLRALAACGAWHPDLNLKNIYLAGAPAPAAYLLDVDRVQFCPGEEVAARNFERLARSARKWRERWGLDFDEDALARLAALAMEKM